MTGGTNIGGRSSKDSRFRSVGGKNGYWELKTPAESEPLEGNSSVGHPYSLEMKTPDVQLPSEAKNGASAES